MRQLLFICAAGHNIICLKVNIISERKVASQLRENIISHSSGHKTMLRQVANDVLRNDVMLRINDVALRANDVGLRPMMLRIEYFVDKALVSCYTIPKGRFLTTEKLYELINEKAKRRRNMSTFTYKGKSFLLDGKPYIVRSGVMHYWRVVPEYWEDRLKKLKACGFNTVETYTCWNLHERKEGQFDFSGRLDVVRYIELAESLGLNVIIRPGPYICSEFDFGGLPSWLLAYEDLNVRCNEIGRAHV